MGYARKLKVSSYVHLPYINKLFQYRHAWMIQCNVEDVYIFKLGRYMSALEHVRMLVLSNYFLLACTNAIYKYCYASYVVRGCISQV